MANFVPDKKNEKSMWQLIETLFPQYRALCGPDFLNSLNILKDWLELDITEYKSGTIVGDWTIPPEFSVNEAWIQDENGERYLDFSSHPYHLSIYSRPFSGTLPKDELLKKIVVSDVLPEAIPMRQNYYLEDWGFCATAEQVESLPEGSFQVHIDTELKSGHLRIGEFYLPGETSDEILINSYLCHPHGANDNLSGVAVGIELFKQLKKLPKRRLSYRLAIWPETIGPITWVNKEKEKLSNLIGGFEVSICGDPSSLTYNKSMAGDGITDRAVAHVTKYSNHRVRIKKYLHTRSGCDQGVFNMPGIRLPFGRIARAGANSSGYREYHTSADDLALVRPEYLLDTLTFFWKVIEVLERNQVWKPNYSGTPFMSRHGIYPYHHGIGRGESVPNQIVEAYYELMAFVDGERDLISIADHCEIPIKVFDEAVKQFHDAGLISPV